MCIGCHLQVRYGAPAHMEALLRETEEARLVNSLRQNRRRPSFWDRLFRRRGQFSPPTPVPEPSMD